MEAVFPKSQRLAALEAHHSAFTEGGLLAKHRQLDKVRESENVDVRKGEGIKEEARIVDGTTAAGSLDLYAAAKNKFTGLKDAIYP